MNTVKRQHSESNIGDLKDDLEQYESEDIDTFEDDLGDGSEHSYLNEDDAAEDELDEVNTEEDDLSDNSLKQDDITEKFKSNPGWADAIAKILKTNKPKNKKVLVLSRAKKLSDVKIKQPKLDFEIVGNDDVKVEDSEDVKDVKPDISKSFLMKEIHRKGRVKPNVLEKDREKALMKIATRGVVQLFNAVRQQQKTVDHKLKKAGKSHRKKQKILETLNKKQLLSKITESAKSVPIDDITDIKPAIHEESTWDVLKEDFMMGSKLKDWDRKEKSSAVNEEDADF